MARSSRGCGPTCRPLRIRITKPWNTRRRFCRAWLSASVSAPGTDTEPEPAGRWWPPHRHRQRPPAPSSFPVGSLPRDGRQERNNTTAHGFALHPPRRLVTPPPPPATAYSRLLPPRPFSLPPPPTHPLLCACLPACLLRLRLGYCS